ncbi:MAG: hypothetical protein M5U34_40200 [Chloroflexi bacterium]|nr:hypothetical protein [Chloroflexota bacterium]
MQDDRILPATRWVAALVAPILGLAFIILYFLPGRTGDFFALTIKLTMTPMMMGAGYLAGAYFFCGGGGGAKVASCGAGLSGRDGLCLVYALRHYFALRPLQSQPSGLHRLANFVSGDAVSHPGRVVG